ncbi:hypothetical protein JW766_00705 [Candidatus Dojkabacteria bacterium]|nr:hypothetical protein [Candidatus Dojkabacteria bacterium]
MANVTTDIMIIRGLQGNMKATVSNLLKDTDLGSMKSKLRSLQNLNSSICQKLQYVATISFKLGGKTHVNANTICNIHNQIGTLISSALNKNDSESLKSTAQSISQQISTANAKASTMESEERTVGPFKNKNIL